MDEVKLKTTLVVIRNRLDFFSLPCNGYVLMWRRKEKEKLQERK